MSEFNPPKEHSTNTSGEATIQHETPFHIVGIGASAGGLEPLETLFKHMPENTGMAFVVVQHLSPDFKSQMEQLLSRKTAMPIYRVEDGIEIKPNSVYLIPPRKMMIVSRGRLLLTDKESNKHLSHPIDEFFRSLAKDAGSRSIGIVLSGSGTDGSKGVVSIAEAGGLTLAQDEESATFDSMPLSALATGAITLSLPPETMPDLLLRYVREALTPALLREEDLLPDELNVRKILGRLRDRFHIDFSMYKTSTVGRRIKRRLMLTNQSDLTTYLQSVADDPEELERLYKDLLIGVTRFFRDNDMFNTLETQVIPKLISVTNREHPLRIWVAACATGEEAYSYAILFHEQLTALELPFNIKIFATDVHQTSIKQASAGIFADECLEHVSEVRRRRYFTRTEGGYLISPELRKVVSFATHNLITDAPFTKMDLISCRNFLIYLQPAAQKKVISMFHFGLNSQGILTMGSSETLGELAGEFEEVSGRHRIYKKKRDVRLPLDPRFDMRSPAMTPLGTGRYNTGKDVNGSREKSLLGVYDHLLDQFMPPAFLLDDKFCIMHIFGGGEKFLKLRGGRASVYFLDLIAHDVRTSFAGALNHAMQKNTVVNYSGIRMPNLEGKMLEHHVSVQPVYDSRSKTSYFFIKLTEQQNQQLHLDAENTTYDVISREHIESLEAELRFSQENLQATIEELETANEELQASNEELVASNEELQSTNEELQSVNEELYTVNHEHQKKIAELIEANDDMDNLLATTRVGVIFLDDRLHIRRYTPEISRIFHLLPQDIGRSIEGFTHGLAYASLVDQLRNVLTTGEEFETETTDKDGLPFILRILPYRTGEEAQPTGVVVTLVDIGNLRRAQLDATRFKTISQLTSDGNALVRQDGSFEYTNPALCESLGYTGQQLMTRRLFDIVDDLSSQQFEQLFNHVKFRKIPPFEARFIRADGHFLHVEISLTLVKLDWDQPLLFIYSRDITSRIQTQQELMLRTRALESAKNGIVICRNTDDREILFANLGFYSITGYSEAEAVGRNCRFLQGEKTSADDLEALRAAVRAGRDSRVCLMNYRKNGEEFWNDLQISPVRADTGEVTHFIGVLNDVTTLRRAEEKCREDARNINLLINSTAEGIIFIDNRHQCVFCNSSAAALLGYASPEDIVGQEIGNLFFAGDDAAASHEASWATSLVAHSVLTGKTSGSDSDFIRRRDGQMVPVEYWNHPIVSEVGDIEGSVLTFIDITERKRNQEKLKGMQERAEQANKAKSDFLANISHELRTPLAAIMGFIELLQGEVAEPSILRKVDTLRRNSQHLLDLLNDLLDLSKIESGYLAIVPEECELLDLLTDSYSMAANRASEKNLGLRFEIREQVPGVISTDPIRCRQILTNLLSNAIKYTDRGHVSLIVSSTGGVEPVLEFAVVDTGRGIDPSERDSLFEPFTRGSSAHLHTTPGSGLGLSISQQLARQLGGGITFESTVGVGSVFRLRLPLRACGDGRLLPAGDLEPRQDVMTRQRVPDFNYRVMIVDDHEDIRSYLTNVLESARATTVGLSDGVEVLALFEGLAAADYPDIILMDMHMPGMGGKAVAEALRAQGIDIPMVAITAGAMKGERERCLLAGFDDYLSKPFDVHLLFKKLLRLVQPASATQGRRQTLAQPDPQRILVVEDSIDVAIATRELLDARGYIVETVYDGRSALTRIHQFQPDAVLMDIGLPDMDGFAVVAELRQRPELSHVAIIAMTGYADSGERQRAMQSGFDEYLIKPVSLTELTTTLSDSVREKRSHANP